MSSEPPSPLPDSQIDPSASIAYWSSISPDVSGMLGGYPQVSRIDLQGSRTFLSKLRRLSAKASASSLKPNQSYPKLDLAVDCGAGIGRVTEGFLSHIAETIDIVEPIEQFAKTIEESKLNEEGMIGEIYLTGLENWQPPVTKRYNLIWNQWCLGHLTDAQLTAYLKRCIKVLAEDGWIVVKENLSTDKFGADLFDDVDSSVTRSDAKFKEIFDAAGLNLVKNELQAGFPKGLGLYPVKMYGLRPK